MVEHNGWKSAFRRFAIGNGEQGINLESVGKIICIIAAVVGSAIEFLDDGDLTAGILPVSQGGDAHGKQYRGGGRGNR